MKKLFIPSFLIAIFFTACVDLTGLDPVLPTWSTSITIPLIDRKFTFADVISKDPKFVSDTAAGAEAIYSPILDKPDATIINLPSLIPKSTIISQKLGVVPLVLPSLPSIAFTPLLLGIPAGFVLPGPDQQISRTLPIIDPLTATVFDYMIFEQGRLVIKLTNTFPFDVTFPSGIRLYNSGDGSEFALLTPPKIPKNTTTAIEVSKSVIGKKMTSNLKMEMIIQTEGLTGTTLSNSNKLEVKSSFDAGTEGTTATLTEAKLLLAGDFDVFDTTYTIALQQLDDSTTLKSASFESGEFDIIIDNGIDCDIVVGFQLNELKEVANGASFQLKQDGKASEFVKIVRKTTLTQKVKLNAYEFRSNTGVAKNNLNFGIRIKTLIGFPDKRVISKLDSVRLRIVPKTKPNGDTEPYVLGRIVGKIKPVYINLNDTIDVAMGDVTESFKFKQIKFDSLIFNLMVNMSGGFVTDLNMKVKSLTKDNVARDSITTGRVRLLIGKDNTIKFPNVDRFISSFFTGGLSLPSKLVMSGRVEVNPIDVYEDTTQFGTISNNDSITTGIEFKFPVRLGITDGYMTDTSDFSGTGLKSSDINIINVGKIGLIMDNTFPLQMKVKGKFLMKRSDTSAVADSVIMYLPLTQDTILVDSSRYYSGGGAGKYFTTIVLQPSDIDLLNKATSIVFYTEFRTSANGAHVVRFKRNDTFHIRAYTTINLNVNKK
ncbi:MAG: hypothetical protein O3A55_07355 [Bacteroidetes bacterium]|nr:hypothetical protein [Bacteroidota bacterium]